MAEDTITNDSVQAPEESRANERITQLSEKVRLEAEARQKAEAEKAEAERRAQFAEGFADMVTTHPSAKEHKDEIQQKVMSGLSVEDATFAVLGKAGKLGQAPQPAPQVAGGSADTAPTGGQKEIKDMSQDERRKILSEALMWT